MVSELLFAGLDLDGDARGLRGAAVLHAGRVVARGSRCVAHVEVSDANREASIGAKYTDELAVMMDSFRPLKVAKQALAISHRGFVLELGRNRFEGTGAALLADPEVKRLYLGG